MYRRLVICAAAVILFLAFALAQKHPVAMAASSGNLTIAAAAPAAGCPLGPAFTFCNQIPGSTGPTSLFTVTPQTTVNGLSVSLAAVPGFAANFTASDFTIVNTSCSGTLTTGQHCAINVAFSPTTAGLRRAVLTVTDSGGDKASINIQGTGANLALATPTLLPVGPPPPAPPSPCLQDNAFTYCDAAIGSTSLAQTFTLTAGGAITGVNLALAAIPGLSSEFNASDFTIVTTTCTGTLPASGSCTIDVAFTPTTAGLRAAALTVTDSASDTATVYLAGHTSTGLAITPPVVPPDCSLGSAFDFCNEPVGGQTPATAFTLTNTSGAQVTGVSVPTGSAAGDFKVLNTTCVATLPANSSCTINVAFTPQNTGLRQDTLSVTDAQGDIGAANFAGTGSDYNLQLASSQSLEATVAAGGTATFSAQVMPDSVFGLNGEQVMFVCPVNLPTNTSCAITPCPASITAGAASNFTITFVTSSATTVAPAPTAACSGYGPVVTSASPGAPGPHLRFPGDPGTGARSPIFPAVALLAILAMLALFFGRMDLPAGRARKGLPLMFACAGLAAVAIFAGCGGHGSTKVTPATPPTTTTMQLQGNAVDAHGNPLNTSRSLHVVLNVTAK